MESLSTEKVRVRIIHAAAGTVTENDVQQFGDVSGDHNPLHFDEEYAKKTMFRGRIAHVPNLRHALIEDAGHMMHHDQPHPLAQHIETFLQSP